MNDNKNSRYFYYVPYGAENYAKVSEIADFSLSGGNAFTLCVGFIESENYGDLIFSENFSLAFHNGYLKLTASGLAQENFNVTDYVISESWNFVTVSYDKTTLKVFINNMLAFEKACSNTDGKAIGSLELGKEFSGYFERILLFSSALTDEEIIKINFASTFDFAPLVFGFLFDSKTPVDLGDRNLSIISMGLSDMVNGVSALSVGSGCGIANYFSQALESEFTIFSKVYLAPTFCDKGYLFSHMNGDFAIYANVASEITMFIEFMGETFKIADKFNPYAWVDFAITFKDGLLTFFADGVSHGTFTPATALSGVTGLVIGNKITNGKVGENNFTGYIDSIATYSTAKTDTQLAEYVTSPPYIFDEDMLEYYDFSYPDFTEQISYSTLALFGNAKVTIARNTSSYAENLPVPFYLPTTPLDRSDYRMWELKNLVSVVKEYYSYIIGEPIDYGEYPTSPQWIAAMTLAEKEILPKTEAQLFLSELAIAVSLLTENTYTAELRYANLFGGTNNRPFMRLHNTTGVVDFTGEGTVMVAGVTDTMAATYAAEYAGAAAWITAGASVVLDAVCKQKSNAAPKKSSGDDDKDPVVSKFSATVASLKFYHSNDSSSALNINSAFETANLSPEYSYIGNLQGGIAYAVNYNKNVIIKATIAVKTSSPCTVTLTGYASGVLGNLSCTFQADSSGVYDVGISSDAVFDKLPTCKNDVSITWIATSAVGSCVAGTTTHTIYTLPSLPISPFDNDKVLINCKSLEIAFRNSDATWNSSNIQANIAKNILADTRFKGERKITGNFTTTGENGLFFNMKAFQTAIGKDTATITPLDSSSLFSILCRSVGKEMDVAKLAPPFGVVEYTSETEYKLAPIFSNPVKCSGETAFSCFDESISNHYVSAKSNLVKNTTDDPFDSREYTVEMGKVFDCFYSLQGEDNSAILLLDMDYSNNIGSQFVFASNSNFYRESFMQNYTCCDVQTAYNNITLTNENILRAFHTPYSMPYILYNSRTGLFTHNEKRPAFDGALRTLIPTSSSEHKCHSYSYKSIATAIVNILNLSDPLKTSKIAVVEQIVFGADISTLALTGLASEIHAHISINMPGLTQTNKAYIATYASSILYAMNSCPHNLRAADKSWNMSIRDCYDVLSWVHSDSSCVMDVSHLGIDETPTGQIPALRYGNTFYVYDPTDCYRISLAKAHAYTVSTLSIYSSKTLDNECFLYSSSNKFTRPTCVECADDIVYLENGCWESLY